ncbi:TetR/AcrR family transcriptional regulator [Cellulosimicrobium arenosum]|uniref:TetR/AcrR family transcriptional regulator n=1 Tax=Cellulosimicrobium arenosum TaxID=2708133 RepID=A0A927G8I2_9MICO|nr:TetR/AcrR family transcriptional regulator [Cellulosimicrobium arenosum]MBD8078902.1 TetR/AcrR family transcriptional regulator [Cellulosimicrobium arenosum]
MTDVSPRTATAAGPDASDAAAPTAPARRVRRPRASTLARREEILRSAMRVFGSKGYHQGSLADVAEQVGITHAGVLHHFGSKDRLLTEVLKFRDEADVEHLEGQHIPGGLDLFRHLVRTAEINSARPGIVQAYTVLTGESVTDGHPASAWVTERFSVLRAEIAEALHEVIADRKQSGDLDADLEISDEAVDRAASSIIGVMDGLQIQWLLDPEAVDLAGATAFSIEAILASTFAGERRPRPLA